MNRNDRYRRKSSGIGREHVSRHHVVSAGRGPAQVILGDAVEGEPEARIDQREVDAQLRQALVQQGRQQGGCLVEGIAGDSPPVAAPRAIVLALLPVGAVPGVIALPERSDLVDGFSAAHFAQVFEKHRHRLQPVAVTIDHWVFQAVVYLCGAILHGQGSGRIYAAVACRWLGEPVAGLRLFRQEQQGRNSPAHRKFPCWSVAGSLVSDRACEGRLLPSKQPPLRDIYETITSMIAGLPLWLAARPRFSAS